MNDEERILKEIKDVLKELDEQMEREAGQQDDLSGWQTDAGGEWQEGETDGMNVYTCQSCGEYRSIKLSVLWKSCNYDREV